MDGGGFVSCRSKLTASTIGARGLAVTAGVVEGDSTRYKVIIKSSGPDGLLYQRCSPTWFFLCANQVSKIFQLEIILLPIFCVALQFKMHHPVQCWQLFGEGANSGGGFAIFRVATVSRRGPRFIKFSNKML